VVSYVIALVQLLSTPSELGVPNLAVREIAVTNVRKDWGYMRGFILWANGVIGAVSLVVAVGAAVVLLVWGHKFDPMRLSCLWLGLLLVPLTSLNALRGSMLRGLRKVLLGQLPEQVIRPLVFLALSCP
jgi:O-antigen/teichoic acid export membrane protein